MREDIEHILIQESEIRSRLAALAAEIERDLPVGPVLVVIVMKGGLVFAVDLLRHMNRAVELECIQVSSYHGGTESSGKVDLVDRELPSVRGKHVLLLDDIWDTGRTVEVLSDHMRRAGAASLRAAVLLAKKKTRDVATPVEYVGFEIGDEFVVGCGLDYRGLYRNLPYIGVLKAGVYT